MDPCSDLLYTAHGPTLEKMCLSKKQCTYYPETETCSSRQISGIGIRNKHHIHDLPIRHGFSCYKNRCFSLDGDCEASTKFYICLIAIVVLTILVYVANYGT